LDQTHVKLADKYMWVYMCADVVRTWNDTCADMYGHARTCKDVRGHVRTHVRTDVICADIRDNVIINVTCSAIFTHCIGHYRRMVSTWFDHFM